MDRLRAMQTFVRIVDEGSLTAAARALDSSLPAVVRTLAALEAKLGVRILNRTTRRISLTDEGRRYLDSCREVLAAVENAETAVSEQAAQPSGRLTITAPVLFGQMYVAPAVTRFVRQYDKLRVSVLLVDRVVNLLEEGIDVGIRIGPLEDSSLVAQPVGAPIPAIALHPRLLGARLVLPIVRILLALGPLPSSPAATSTGRLPAVLLFGNLWSRPECLATRGTPPLVHRCVSAQSN